MRSICRVLPLILVWGVFSPRDAVAQDQRPRVYVKAVVSASEILDELKDHAHTTDVVLASVKVADVVADVMREQQPLFAFIPSQAPLEPANELVVTVTDAKPRLPWPAGEAKVLLELTSVDPSKGKTRCKLVVDSNERGTLDTFFHGDARPQVQGLADRIENLFTSPSGSCGQLLLETVPFERANAKRDPKDPKKVITDLSYRGLGNLHLYDMAIFQMWTDARGMKFRTCSDRRVWGALTQDNTTSCDALERSLPAATVPPQGIWPNIYLVHFGR